MRTRALYLPSGLKQCVTNSGRSPAAAGERYVDRRTVPYRQVSKKFYNFGEKIFLLGGPIMSSAGFTVCRRYRLALVEDHDDSRDLVKTYLEDRFDVHSFKSARHFLAALNHHTFEAVLTDVRMPEVTGIELVKILRMLDEYRNTPVIGFSGLAMEHDRHEALAAGFTDYFTKPVDLEQVAIAIERYLAMPRSQS